MITHWYCGICGERRPDEAISVWSYPSKGLPGATVNLKYCNDKPECHRAAKLRSKTGGL